MQTIPLFSFINRFDDKNEIYTLDKLFDYLQVEISSLPSILNTRALTNRYALTIGIDQQ